MKKIKNQNQNKSKIAVLLVRERKDGTIRQGRIKNAILIFSALSFLVIAVTLISFITAGSSTKRLSELAEYEVKVEELSDELNSLQRENYDLSNKLSVLSETVATQVAVAEVREEEGMLLSLPSGFPLGSFGASTVQEEEEDALTLIFTASEGNTIITVGAGIVEAIEPDERYGNRLIIDHQNGYKSIYLNQGQPLVRIGAELGKGYILFLVGSDNKNLGFQVTENENQIDPMDVMEISG
ncbi:MAG: M23 family metallopeptidase [Lachnospiraceae bacterium]|nr:M23 family metallopeptidase [Lachnospiraceae bacterium]